MDQATNQPSRDGNEDAIGRVLIDRALGGDPVAARFLIDGLNPKPRQRTITLDLPEGADAAWCAPR